MKKANKTYLFIGISSIALCIVIAIQVIWVLRTAQVKRALFNEKANMVLAKTVHSLPSGSFDFRNGIVYIDEVTKHEIDSLLQCNLKLYDLDLDYQFESVENTTSFHSSNNIINPQIQPNLSQACMSEVPTAVKGFELKLFFPEKEKYILAEIGLPFITSVILIILVLVMSWRTILSLQKEKKLSEYTTEFLNNMTHEFKTPLTNIALAGKMITKEINLNDKEKISHYSSIILNENEKLRLQVEQVLSMTALERGEVPLQKSKTDIHQLIKEAVRHMGVQLENINGQVELELNSKRFQLEVDRTHLTNALYNLIDNSIKYADKPLKLGIQTQDDEEHFVMIVKDNGPGIPKDYSEKIFDKYFRIPTGNLHDIKGFGLGLAYVKQIVLLHQGSIKMESEKGTIFTITLPNG